MLAGLAFCEILSHYPRSAFQGLCGGHQRGVSSSLRPKPSASICSGKDFPLQHPCDWADGIATKAPFRQARKNLGGKVGAGEHLPKRPFLETTLCLCSNLMSMEQGPGLKEKGRYLIYKAKLSEIFCMRVNRFRGF